MSDLSALETPEVNQSLAQPGPQLTVVVPTFNERENVAELIRRLDSALAGISWEVLFVDDDSPDLTADAVRSQAQRDSRVRCLQRLGRRGLSSACIEGMLASSAPFVAVIDGDLQHDERLLKPMLEALKRESLDIVVGSRYVAGGGAGGLDQSRLRISRLATRLGRRFVPETLTDPMSGFFMMRREVLPEVAGDLSGVGFKILLDLFASSKRPLRFRELPYEFRARYAGESKLDSQVAWEYAMLLLDKLIGRYVPVRFIAFSIVGGFGMGVHLVILAVAYRGLAVEFVTSQIIATGVAMTFNYAVNNALTYRDRRLKGWNWFRGWVTFVIGCSIGAFANVGVAAWLFQRQYQWVVAAIAGILVGSVWNYAVTFVYTWNKPRRA
jgi:dolichol-phosphate mannosyltransferase